MNIKTLGILRTYGEITDFEIIYVPLTFKLWFSISVIIVVLSALAVLPSVAGHTSPVIINYVSRRCRSRQACMVVVKNPVKCRRAVSHVHDTLKSTVWETAVSTPSVWWWRCWHLESSSVKIPRATASDLTSSNFTLSEILIVGARSFWGPGTFHFVIKPPPPLYISLLVQFRPDHSRKQHA